MTLAHALSAVTSVTSVLCQAHQSEVIVSALWTIARMQDDSVHAVFVLVFLRNEGVIIADAYFVCACAIAVPERKKDTKRWFLCDFISEANSKDRSYKKK